MNIHQSPILTQEGPQAEDSGTWSTPKKGFVVPGTTNCRKLALQVLCLKRKQNTDDMAMEVTATPWHIEFTLDSLDPQRQDIDLLVVLRTKRGWWRWPWRWRWR